MKQRAQIYTYPLFRSGLTDGQSGEKCRHNQNKPAYLSYRLGYQQGRLQRERALARCESVLPVVPDQKVAAACGAFGAVALAAAVQFWLNEGDAICQSLTQ